MTPAEKLWLEERFRRLEDSLLATSMLRIEIAALILGRLDKLIQEQDLNLAVSAHAQRLESRAEEIRELAREINNQERMEPPPAT